jgi:hypothetical protein
MGVWTTALTRQAVFEALWNRRVFASTNVRIYLEFSVCGAPMGARVTTTATRPIRVRAASDKPIATVEIIRNGVDWRVIKFNQQEVDCAIEDSDTTASAWYYARITRADGEMAWSSPVWVEI